MIGHAAPNTMSAASGSFQMFASAEGLTLPGQNPLPPISTISRTFSVSRGSSRIARAMLVSGPTGTRVISPGAAITVRTMNSAALWSTALFVGAAMPALPWPSAPWTKSTGPPYEATSGVLAPRATGMSERPASSSNASALYVVVSVVAFPKIVVSPTTSSSGDDSA